MCYKTKVCSTIMGFISYCFLVYDVIFLTNDFETKLNFCYVFKFRFIFIFLIKALFNEVELICVIKLYTLQIDAFSISLD